MSTDVNAGSQNTTEEGAKRRVVLLFGGRSSEHGISCVTAAGVLNAIDRSKFEVIPVGITKRGATVLLSEADLADYKLVPGGLPEVVENGTRVLWPASIDTRALSLIREDGTIASLGHVDVVLPTLHGPFGEDGTLQGLLDLVDLPYVGSGVLGSALAMDKHVAKTVLADAGIAVAPWRTITRHEFDRDPSVVARLDEGLSYPLFVKPARAGSSVGVSKVKVADELPAALEVAFAEDSIVLIESGVVGREVEIAVLQGRNGSAPRTSSVIGEIAFSGREFYDFEAKYLGASGVELVLPAPVTDAEFESIRDAAVRSFEAAQLAGLSRIDFFLTEQGPVLNEINTLPGFTPVSMYPRLWEESGLAYKDLITELIELALERQA
ncbi:D-alanine--D-alanine ligase family protein [Leucobacter sp. UT-8R-CII-1-4]|uniref:D-alanine--D-alanine ligase family protein n=1 Tax=Leucobacter sp. UT-8R-CII-1-4 TaxID=3040075 RepID=UPI0024A9712A|nr:D-alanine--D-alanine ligase family protein [Leucobacter sp. UT-8R-CII-1-4]MDI6023208.1 D-alanine--D-alanine ligase family protein [Leucobacter sp. UT-8R-CII-1-4]